MILYYVRIKSVIFLIGINIKYNTKMQRNAMIFLTRT